mgnify:CR=1 FL=1|jgi:hypothetical protein
MDRVTRVGTMDPLKVWQALAGAYCSMRVR